MTSDNVLCENWFLLNPGQTIATRQRNISQHCWTQHVVCVWQAPFCNMSRRVGRNVLCAFGTHPFATCRDVLGATCCVRLARTLLQHVATCWAQHVVCVWHAPFCNVSRRVECYWVLGVIRIYCNRR